MASHHISGPNEEPIPIFGPEAGLYEFSRGVFVVMNRFALYRHLWTVAMMAVSVSLTGQTNMQVTPAARRITANVNNADRITLPVSVRPQLSYATDLGAVPASMPAHHMLMVLTRSEDRQQQLAQYLKDVQNPSSSNYHKWLTPAQYGAMFGASTDDIATVSMWLQSQGLTVDKVSPAGNVIQFSGNVAQVQTAFGTQIHQFLVNGERHMANISSPQIPRAFSSAVSTVLGLDDFHPRPQIQKAPTAKFDPMTKKIVPDFTLFDSSSTPYLYVNPSDAATIYNVPNAVLNPNYHGTTYDGTGVNVGVVGDSNVDLTPVKLYREDFLNETDANVNLPTVVIDGADPGVNGDEVETFLDLEVLGGIAPKAKIYYYTSDDSDLSAGLFDAIERAINDNTVSVLSISYGECEANAGSALTQFLAEEYQQAAAQGITVAVSTGDAGAAGCDAANATIATHGLGINALGSSPYNVAVGGTDYAALASNFGDYVQYKQNGQAYSGTAPYWRTALKYIPELPWNDSTYPNGALASNTPLLNAGKTNIIGGGGGISMFFSKPAYQTGLTPNDGKRDVPDVSFLAGNGLYGAVWLVCGAGGFGGPDCQESNGNFTANTTFSGAGGTSAATPAFAGMLALVVQANGSRLGQANNVLYQLAASNYGAVFHDVTSGNNSVVCTASTPNCGSNGFITGYDAAPGYDLASGLGSVDAAAMLSNWKSAEGAVSSTTLQINGSTAAINAVHGTSLNFDVAVTPANASGTAALITNKTAATGTSGLNGLTSVPVNNGNGSLTYNGLPGGSYSVYARFSGSTANAASDSTPITVNIAAEDSSTLLMVNAYGVAGPSEPISNLSQVPYGSYIFADPTVYGTAEGYEKSLGYATGTFTVLDNGKSIGTASINSGNFASFPGMSSGIYPYSVGLHKLTATYPGDDSYKPNTSNEVDITVVKGATKGYIFSQSATLRSTASEQVEVDVATSSFASVPTGTITLTANGVTLGTSSAILTGYQGDGTVVGYVDFNVSGSQLNGGANTLTATYSGDGNYTASTATSTITVLSAGFTLKAGTIAINAGSTTGNTATISATPANGFAGLVNLSCSVAGPTGAISPVTCSVPSSINITGTGTVTGTLTANTTATTTSGTYTVTINGVDAATGKITASTTTTVSVTGQPGIVLSNSGPLTLKAGATTGNTATISVTPANGYTGTVGLSCAVTSMPAGATSPVTCSLSPASVNIAGGNAATAALTVNSTAPTSANMTYPNLWHEVSGTVLAFGFILLIPVSRRRMLSGIVVMVVFISIGTMVGCGGSGNSGGGSKPPSNPGTTAGTYVITVTSTASGLGTQTTTITVTVS